MPFVFVAEPKVWWPVKVRVPRDGGIIETSEFEARFRVVSATRFNELLAAGARELLADVLVMWRGILDEDGALVPFAMRDQLLDIPFIATALADAYADLMLTGARKN
jgi:hypothetical protein